MNPKQQSPSSQGPRPQPSARSENRDAPSHAGQAGAGEHARAQSGGDDARDPTSDARQLATDVAQQVSKTAERQLAGGKDRAAEAIGHLAEALRETGGQLRAKEMPAVDEYLGRAATQVESVARYLQQKQLGQVVGDLESFARREPMLFVGSAFVVGLLGGRFLRSSAAAIGEHGPGR
jgi:ElaB/YqjD/DUF883 family membrane-anchored ribosome-binding protein